MVSARKRKQATGMARFIVITSIVLLFFSFIVITCTASITNAAEVNSGIAQQIQTQFETKATEYGTKLKGYALGIFKLFLLVGVVVFGVQAALGRAEIADVIKEFIIMLLFAAFCYVAIQYYHDWTKYILEKTDIISANVGGAELELSPIDLGFTILNTIIEKINSLSWGFSAVVDGIAYLLIGAVILCCLALMSARILVVICEAYIAMNVAILLLGFGAASFMKEYAVNVMRYVVSLAFKVLVMNLILGIGISFIKDLGNFDKISYEVLFVLLAASLVLLVIIQTIPETVAGIINGSHTGGGVGLRAATGAALGAMAATYAVASKGVGGAGGVVSGVSRAAKIASLQGEGGVGGTANQIWRSYQEARQDERRAGVGPSAVGELRRMGSSLGDMYSAARSASDSSYTGNPYSRNQFSGNPYVAAAGGTAQAAPSSQRPNPAAQAAASFGSTAGQAQAAADARSEGQHGAAPFRTAGADQAAQAAGSTATSREALRQQKENSKEGR